MFRRGIVLVALVACSSEETGSSNAADASTDGSNATDGSGGDGGPITPASDGGCDGSVPGMSAGSDSQCAGKQGQPAPGGTGADPGASCAAAEDCKPICCTCSGGDAGATFVSSVSVCGCGNVCASAEETCAFYEKTFALCQ